MLKSKISDLQAGNYLVAGEMIEKFDPIIRKYGRKLGGEDGYQDMALFFITTLNTFPVDKLSNTSDGAIVNYLKATIYHGYIDLSKKACEIKDREYSTDVFPEASEELNYDYFEDIISIRSLSEKERNVLRLMFKQDCSAAEVARMIGTTRQNVNQIKHKALKKLKEALQ